MPEINVEQAVNAPVEKVFAIAKDIERFPEWMDNMESVKITSREGDTTVSEWVARIEEFKRMLRWTEEDIWNDATRRCTFRALEGDWDTYAGVWDFLPEGEGTRMRMQLNYEFNVPLIGALIKGLLLRLVTKNTQDMLAALAKRAEQE